MFQGQWLFLEWETHSKCKGVSMKNILTPGSSILIIMWIVCGVLTVLNPKSEIIVAPIVFTMWYGVVQTIKAFHK